MDSKISIELKIVFSFVCVLQILQIIFLFAMGISLGYTLAFLNIFELIFAILPLILIWTIQDEEDGKLNEGRRCFSSCHRFKLDVPVYFYFIIYAIWCISRVISSIIGLLIWTNQIKFSPDNLAVRYLFGSSGESSQSTLVQIVINSILISLQTIGSIFGIVIGIKLKEMGRIQYQGFA